jgi:hypothetical protein
MHKLRLQADHLRARGVVHLALFGSLARGEATPDSDIDIVVDIDPGRRFSLLDQADLRLFFGDLLEREADVVIREDLRPAFRQRIAAEEVRVF